MLTDKQLQEEANYGYDKSGNLIQDKSEEISNITWSSTGKVKTIARPSTSVKPEILFSYDAFGHRIAKTTIKKITNTPDPGVYPVPPTTLQEITTTYYVRDAQGNELCSYSYKDNPWGEGTGWNTNNGKILQINDHTIYGSSRLGTSTSNKVYESSFMGTVSDPNPPVVKRILGMKTYELSNHLGNVMQTVTDRKLPVLSSNLAEIKYYTAEVVSYSDYYPFGQVMPNRHGDDNQYRYGFGGHEKVDEYSGEGNQVDMGDRWLDVRLGRTSKPDIKASKYPDLSPYSYASNNPLIFVDPDGMDIKLAPGLTQAQKLEIVGTLQQLTNDKLVYKTLKDGSVQIKIASLAKSGTETKNAGTTLLRELNSSEKIVTIDYKNSQGSFSTNDGNKARALDYTNASNGLGSDAIVSFDPDSNPDIMTVDPETGNSTGQKRPNKIGLGHELIHAEHYMEGSYSPEEDEASHTFQIDGNPIEETYKKEELRTVGLAGNKKGDHTENQLRKENNLEKRGAYQTYE